MCILRYAEITGRKTDGKCVERVGDEYSKRDAVQNVFDKRVFFHYRFSFGLFCLHAIFRMFPCVHIQGQGKMQYSSVQPP